MTVQNNATAMVPRSIGYYYEDLPLGVTAMFSKTITETDITLFAGVSGDTNPLHLDAEYAATTRFKGRIAHGMLTASLISTIVGTRLPGPGCVYVGQTLKFKAPVRIGDTVVAFAEVTGHVPERKFVILKTQCLVGATVVLDGEATILVPSRGT